MNNRNQGLPWDSSSSYGQRFDEINTRLGKSFALAEYRTEQPDDTPILQYRLAKLAIAAEDIRRAVKVIEEHGDNDDWVADAVVELRNACTEIVDSFTEADPLLVQLLNHFSG